MHAGTVPKWPKPDELPLKETAGATVPQTSAASKKQQPLLNKQWKQRVEPLVEHAEDAISFSSSMPDQEEECIWEIEATSFSSIEVDCPTSCNEKDLAPLPTALSTAPTAPAILAAPTISAASTTPTTLVAPATLVTQVTPAESEKSVALKILEFQQEDFTSNFLNLPDLPLNIYWDDLMASLAMAGPLMDHPVILYAMQMIKDGRKTFWLQICSRADTLKVREFLHGRCSSNDIFIQCQFKEERAFKEVHQMATCIWSKGDLNFKPSEHCQSESPPLRDEHYNE